MKVSNVSFKRALTSGELEEYKFVLAKAKEKVNGGGKSILIVHDTCLPQAAATDTGIGHLTSKSSDAFFEFAKNRLGINAIEVLPQGDMSMKHKNGFYNTYNASALSLGSHEIDLELLTDEKHGAILSKEDFQKVVDANAKSQKAGLVNYENIIGAESPHEKALKTAYQNFMESKSTDKKAFEAFKLRNADWLDRKAVYSVLREENGDTPWKQWKSEIDRTLFDSVDAKRTARLEELSKTKSKKIDFYKFKQFLAEEHLKEARKTINEKGMKLFGDCLIGFGDDETWAFKKAFKKDVYIGLPEWGLPALDYDEILKQDSPAQKLLKKKVELFARRYDGIRFDCSWSYAVPKLSDKSEYKFGGQIFDIIESTVKSVKGKKYVPTDLIHEFEADPSDFSPLKHDGTLKSFLKKRTQVISSAYLGENYGTTESVLKSGTLPDRYILGVGNHDPQPLRQIAENIGDDAGSTIVYRRSSQAKTLEKLFGLKSGQLASPTEFSKTKFAEPLLSKNQMMFYMDVFGRSERFDAQAKNGWQNYRYRISPDFVKEYEKTVASGFGYNPMDAYSRVFRYKGLDKSEKTLYSQIVKFRDILQDKAVEFIDNAKNLKNIRRNRLINIVSAVVGLGIIGTVVASANNSLQKQSNK